MLEVRGALLTLRELATQRVFTANYDAVRRSTMPALPHCKSLLYAPGHRLYQYAPGPHFPQYRALRLHFLFKRRHRKFRRIPSKCSVQPPPHFCSMPFHLQSQHHQRATGPLTAE